jgi:hypothetical protein
VVTNWLDYLSHEWEECLVIVICEGYEVKMGARGSVVLKALCYKPEGCRFETR